MKRTASTCLMIVAAAVGLHGQNSPPEIVEASITVTGVGDKSVIVYLSDLSKLPQHTVKTTDHGTPVSFSGVLLTDVLAKADMPTGAKFHSTAASYYLVVEARDRYRAVFAWAELDPGFMDKPVYVIMKRDGKPLSEEDGPFQLVVPGENRHARWVRQVTALRIRQAN
ncbi:MAG: molybdopterin-dependent oxidoreductase [Bryobacteraceae bacterium]